MDWERTLNIFIIAFLILNLALAVQLWLRPIFFNPANYISAEEIAATKSELEDRNITVIPKIPRRMKRLQPLGVKNASLEEGEVAAVLLGPEFEKLSSGVKTEYRSVQGKVDFYVDGRINYLSSSPQEGGSISQREAQKLADQFLRRTVGQPRDAKKARTKLNKDGTWTVEYRQRWNGKELEISKIILVVGQGGSILQMEYLWVDVIGYVGEKTLSIPATAALKVAARQMQEGTTVSRLYLSWYSKPVLSEQWRVSPVWVVETEEGDKHYVNAHTGELEGEQ